METNIWVLIEKYYSDYYSSNNIARLNDLSKIIEGEYEEDDCAHQLLITKYSSNPINWRIKKDHDTLYIEVLEKTMTVMNHIIEKNGSK